MRGWGATQLPDSQQAAAAFKFLAPNIHEHRSVTGPIFTLDAIRVKWSSQPKKAKSLPSVSPWPLAAFGVTRSLADRAGSAGHGEKKESLLNVSVKSNRLRQSTSRCTWG
jgi:hypothetical protein